RPPPRAPLFPYTTLFRSRECGEHHSLAAAGHAPGDLLAEPPLGLLGDLDAALPGLLAEAPDEAVDERGPLGLVDVAGRVGQGAEDRKSTRLNSSHVKSSY